MGQAKRKAEDFGNHVPVGERALAVVIATLSFWVAWDLALSDALRIVEYRRGGWLTRLLNSEWRPEVVVLHGWPVFWAYLVLVLITLMALTFLIDHYDRRFNAAFYVRLRHVMLWATALVTVIGTAVAMIQITHQ